MSPPEPGYRAGALIGPVAGNTLYYRSMPAYRVQKLEHELRRMCQALPGVQGSVVVSIEGLVMAAYPPVPEGRIDSDNPTSSPQVAAMSAALIALGAQTLSRLAQGDMDRLLVEGNDGGIIIVPSGP